MSTTVATKTETTARKAVAIPMGKADGKITVSFTREELELIAFALTCESSSWRVQVINEQNRKQNIARDAKRVDKGLEARDRATRKGTIVLVGGKAKKLANETSKTEAAQRFIKWVEITRKVKDVVKASN